MGTYNYNHRLNINEMNEFVMALSEYITALDKDRLMKYLRHWNFYEGYHWEDIQALDKPQITKNYCRPFVDKFVAFEFGKGFNIKVEHEDDGDPDTPSPVTNFLNEIWEEHNNKMQLCVELGQTKSVTGKGWVQVKYESPEELKDPFGEYENGRIRLINMSPNSIYPEYDPHDKEKLVKLTVMYPIKEVDKSPILKKPVLATKVYKMVWTDEEVMYQIGKEEPKVMPNPYGIIPFVEFTNYPLANKTEGISDLDDIIPLNVELNLKNSDISEIIDYHASPVTLVYGANVGSLERGANKMWGGLPKDAKVENLNMNTDLGASLGYTSETKHSIHEIGCVPESALGNNQSISNTSGVALQIVHMPLIERTRVKRISTTTGLQKINKLIMLIGLQQGFITVPEGVTPKEFYKTDITFPDALPKDDLIELQKIESEMRLGLESRHGAMDRMGKNVKQVLSRIDEDFEDNAQFYGHQPKELNSGMMNGETQQELVNKEINGQNVSSTK